MIELPLLTVQQYYRLQSFEELNRLVNEGMLPTEEVAPRLKHQDRVVLQEVYSDWTGEPPADIYCNECVNELFRRLMKEVERFKNIK